MTESKMMTVEINGVRYELDQSLARKITSFKVGDRVKVLVKDYSGYTVHVGAIVGIDAFQALPSVVVAYVPANAWTDPDVKFVTLNAQTKDVEIAPLCGDEITPTKATIHAMFDKAQGKLENDLDALKAKRAYFDARFGGSISSALAERLVEDPASTQG